MRRKHNPKACGTYIYHCAASPHWNAGSVFQITSVEPWICVCYDQWVTQSHGEKLDGSFHVGSTRNRDTSNMVVSAQGLLSLHLVGYWPAKSLRVGSFYYGGHRPSR